MLKGNLLNLIAKFYILDKWLVSESNVFTIMYAKNEMSDDECPV